MLELKSRISDAFRTLHEETSDLYLGSEIEETQGWPEPLPFYRDHVSRNLPLIMRSAAADWPSVKKWSPEYFRETMGNKKTRVAVTANGLADAVATGPDGKEYFVLPYETEMTFNKLLDIMKEKRERYITYVQSQNSNLKDYPELIADVPTDIEFATQAFGNEPDAVNFWMGDGRAVTSMHKDPYENVYCVIHGYKDFVLIPPTELPRVPHQMYPVARFTQLDDGLRIVPDEDAKPIPWVSLDPLQPSCLPPRAYRVRVRAGDALYLPSLWFHHVSQSDGCIAVNYWYDMQYDIKYCYYKMLEVLTAHTR